jgi:hypothetical protein
MPDQSDIPQSPVRVRRTSAAHWSAMLALALLAVPWQAPAQEGYTLKERLSDKASDDQRVDNCHVSVERRGTKPRPDCPEEPRPPTAAEEAGIPAAPKPR